MRGLYVHIPFCEHICFYCDFAKRVAKNNEMIEDYLTHLERDFCSITQSVCAYDTIYIGGGTPSMVTQTEANLYSFASLQTLTTFSVVASAARIV